PLLTDPAPPAFYTLSLHDALPISLTPGDIALLAGFFSMVMTAVLQLNSMLPVMTRGFDAIRSIGEILECPDVEENRGKRAVEKRSEEHTSELQSPYDLVCRLLLEK